MQKPILPKRTRDFNSDELYKRNYIINIIKENFSKFGFNPIETPSFERSETLLGKYGQDGERLIFNILKSKRDEIILKLELPTKEEFDILKKRVENLERSKPLKIKKRSKKLKR